MKGLPLAFLIIQHLIVSHVCTECKYPKTGKNPVAVWWAGYKFRNKLLFHVTGVQYSWEGERCIKCSSFHIFIPGFIGTGGGPPVGHKICLYRIWKSLFPQMDAQFMVHDAAKVCRYQAWFRDFGACNVYLPFRGKGIRPESFPMVRIVIQDGEEVLACLLLAFLLTRQWQRNLSVLTASQPLDTQGNRFPRMLGLFSGFATDR